MIRTSVTLHNKQWRLNIMVNIGKMPASQENLSRMKAMRPSEIDKQLKDEYYQVLHGGRTNLKTENVISNMSKSERKQLLKSLLTEEYGERQSQQHILENEHE